MTFGHILEQAFITQWTNPLPMGLRNVPYIKSLYACTQHFCLMISPGHKLWSHYKLILQASRAQGYFNEIQAFRFYMRKIYCPNFLMKFVQPTINI